MSPCPFSLALSRAVLPACTEIQGGMGEIPTQTRNGAPWQLVCWVPPGTWRSPGPHCIHPVSPLPLTLSLALTSTRASARRAATTGACPQAAAVCRGVPASLHGRGKGEGGGGG